jgi:hypothetical protein
MYKSENIYLITVTGEDINKIGLLKALAFVYNLKHIVVLLGST